MLGVKQTVFVGSVFDKTIVPTNLERNQVVTVDVENDMLGAHDLNARRHFDVSAIATLSVLAFDHAPHNVSRHQ